MTPSLSDQAPSAPVSTADTAEAACALCGLTAADDPALLRQLGEPPVVVTVCADSDACVTRYAAR